MYYSVIYLDAVFYADLYVDLTCRNKTSNPIRFNPTAASQSYCLNQLLLTKRMEVASLQLGPPEEFLQEAKYCGKAGRIADAKSSCMFSWKVVDGVFGVFSAMRRLTVVIVTFWIVFPIARRLTMTSLVPGRSPALRRVLFVLVPLGHRRRWVGGLANPLSASGRDAPNLVIGIILLGVVISVRVILPLNLLNSCFLGLTGRSMVILVLSKFSSGLSRCNSACGRCCIMANLLDRLFFAWLLVGLPPVRLLLGLGAVSLVCVGLAFWQCWFSAGPVFGAVALSGFRLPSFLTLARFSVLFLKFSHMFALCPSLLKFCFLRCFRPGYFSARCRRPAACGGHAWTPGCYGQHWCTGDAAGSQVGQTPGADEVFNIWDFTDSSDQTWHKM